LIVLASHRKPKIGSAEAMYWLNRRILRPSIVITPRARLWLEEAGSDWTLPRFVRLRAEAAVLLSEGRRIEATEACDHALATLRREFPSGRLPASEQDWILEIRARGIDSA